MKSIAVIGLGYAGLTLAVRLANKGLTVYGCDSDPRVLAGLSAGSVHLYEPGVADGLRAHLGGRIRFVDTFVDHAVDAAVLCVSTPVDASTRRPVLENLRQAARSLAESLDPGTLVVVRSTVPVGTSRQVVLSELAARWDRPRLVHAPERTIQGQALRELDELPQIVGALDEESWELGMALWSAAATRVIRVSSLEAAEMVKLVNNCHTDLIYSFGNEVALLSQRLGLDPLEIIRAANQDYPRPDLSEPGFVGGGCLSKDPYLLLGSTGLADYRPWLVDRARALNERIPVHVAERFLHLIEETRGSAVGARVLLLGFAYKGKPATDDLRAAPSLSIVPVLQARGVETLGHDPLADPRRLQGLGVKPVSIEEGFSGSDGVLVITDHPDYARLDLERLLPRLRKPAVFFDSWRILPEARVRAEDGVRYAGIGYG